MIEEKCNSSARDVPGPRNRPRIGWLINLRIQGLAYRLGKGQYLYVGFPRLLVKRPKGQDLPLELGQVDGSQFFRFNFEGTDVRMFFDPELQHDARQVILETFSSDVYHIDVTGRDVVDIGANIGDTAIYFALRGAKRVIAFEPYPSAYQVAKLNVEANSMGNKVTMLNEGIGMPSTLTIDPTFKVKVFSQLRVSEAGVRVRLRSLKDLVRSFGLREAVLKLDCEGCEYGAIMGTSPETLACFKTILMEYHYGSKGLVRRLRKAGFSVQAFYRGLVYYVQRDSANPFREKGYLLATRK